jgi:hypothetical protein
VHGTALLRADFRKEIRMSAQPCEPKFPLGHLVATPNALKTPHPDDIQAAIIRHGAGDWGDICKEDFQSNQSAVAEPVGAGKSIGVNCRVSGPTAVGHARGSSSLPIPNRQSLRKVTRRDAWVRKFPEALASSVIHVDSDSQNAKRRGTR